MLHALYYIRQHVLLSDDVPRVTGNSIFKLSGRYSLTASYEYGAFDCHPNKAVFKQIPVGCMFYMEPHPVAY
jgi:hypothetical protein